MRDTAERTAAVFVPQLYNCIVDYATGGGTAEVAAQLRFFESGFTIVGLTPTGQLPSGASMSVVGVPVMQLAVANHCSIH